MELRRFGWTGALVPVIGQGTWNLEGDARPAAVAALRRGLDLGMTHVEENAAATAFELTAGDLAALEQAFPARRGTGGLPII